MKTPLTLTIPAAVLGVVFPLAAFAFATHAGHPAMATLLCVASWAIIPVVATTLAYKHGYDRGLANGRERSDAQGTETDRA